MPGDIETLTGESVAVALDAEFDPDAVESSPEELPAGFVVKGDPDEIQAVLEKIKANLPADEQATMVWRADGDGVLVGTRTATSASSPTAATSARPPPTSRCSRTPTRPRRCSSSTSTPAMATGWLPPDLAQLDSKDASDNLEPLSAFGVSAWVDGDVIHALMRLTTD